MERETKYLPSAGGGRLFCRLWLPTGAPCAVLVLAHGVCEHSGRYDALAQYLAERGYAVAAMDHMGHGCSDGVPGGFTGGWETAVEDVRRTLWRCRLRWPDVPLFLMGHSMGSFLVRTLLIEQPYLPLTGVLLSGTAQFPRFGTAAVAKIAAVEVALHGEQMAGGAVELANRVFNLPFAPNRSPWDWVSRDSMEAEAIIRDPLCDKPPLLGLQRDLLYGVAYNQNPAHLARMNKQLPVLFFSGTEDPVGLMGRGVLAAAESFRRAGMEHITVRLYSGARHDTLHDRSCGRVYLDLYRWMEERKQQESY